MDRRATWRLTRWTVRSKVKSRRVADVWHKAWAFGGAIGHGTGEGITQREEEGVFVSILKMPSQVILMSGPFSQMTVTGLIVFLEKFWICIFKKEVLDPSGYEML